MLRDPENAGHPDLRPGNPPAETARRSRQTAPGARNSACYRRIRDFSPSSAASWMLRLNKIRTNSAYSTLAAPKILLPGKILK